jgi:hypothetical protein
LLGDPGGSDDPNNGPEFVTKTLREWIVLIEAWRRVI